jgi:hypothetical protein
MKFSLKPRVFLIGFLPGFLFILAFLISYKEYNLHTVKKFAESISLFSGIAIVILSFIIGQIFDSFRDFFIEEKLFICLFKTKLYQKYLKNVKCLKNGDINWNFFSDASEKEIDKLDNNCYLFYLVNVNLSLCLIIISTLIFFNWPNEFKSFSINNVCIINKFWLLRSIFVSVLILVLDALILRNEVARITKSKKSIIITPVDYDK